MELTINELLRGKATIIKDKEYYSTEAYVTPFLEKMSKFTDDFRIQAKLSDQLSITKKEDKDLEDTVYNRVWIQAVMPEELSYANHKEVIGFIYGLDTRKPVYKIYRGALNMACLNLCVFNPTFINIKELEPEKALSLKCIDELMALTSDIKVWLDKLDSIEIPYEPRTINENLGSWIRNTLSASYNTGFGKVKLATNMAIDAYKSLYEKKDSPYYINPGDTTSMFNVYNAFTDLISNSDARDIMNKAEKTFLLREVLQLYSF